MFIIILFNELLTRTEMIIKFFQRAIKGFIGLLPFKKNNEVNTENGLKLVLMGAGDKIQYLREMVKAITWEKPLTKSMISNLIGEGSPLWERIHKYIVTWGFFRPGGLSLVLKAGNAKRVFNNYPEGLIPRNILSIAPKDDVLQFKRFYALLLRTIVVEPKIKEFLCRFALRDSSSDTHRCSQEQLVNNDDTLAAVSATAYQVEALQHLVFHLHKAELLTNQTTSRCLLLGSASSDSGYSLILLYAVAPTSLGKKRLPISYLEAGDPSKRGVKRKPILRGRKKSLTSLSRPNNTFLKSVGGLPRPQFGACTAASYWLWNYPRSIFRVNCTSLRGCMTAPAALVWWKVSTFIGLVRSLRAVFDTFYLISLFLEALVSSPVKGQLLILFRHVSDPPATLVVSNKCQSFIFSLVE